MSADQIRMQLQSYPETSRPLADSELTAGRPGPAGLNGYSVGAIQDGLAGPIRSQEMMEAPEFPDFSFPYHGLPESGHIIGLEDHGADLFSHTAGGSIPSIGDRKDSLASGSNFALGEQSIKTHPRDSSEHESPGGNQHRANSIGDNMSDEFGLSTNIPLDAADHAHSSRDPKSDITPAWTDLKTKAGKERKRLPLACIVCRRKKIRCSGEKPACKHCLRARIPCVYKVTTRKAAPRTDYMAMLDKRLKRMEDRILKIVPKSEQDPAAANVVRAQVKPQLPSSASASKQGGKKRPADEAFAADLDNWARQPQKAKADDSNKPAPLQVQEQEDGKLLVEGREALPPKDIQMHLADIFFENIYGQAYHLLHKPSYMRKLKYVIVSPQRVNRQ